MKTLRSITIGLFCASLALVSVEASAQAKPATTVQGLYKTIYDMLRDVPGLEVKTNNGRGSTVIVRGIATLRAGSSTPLYVVDGSTMSDDNVGNINPQDVDGITVLKDGASLTAYGSQGSNGVILITMKKGATISNKASVESHAESAYTYFIDHKTPLKVFGLDDKVIIEGVIEKQRGDTLIFVKKRKDFLVSVSSIKRVEMVPQN
jgi:TonB-dependent SusC/RagA subfamily outer membrane receptor